MKADFKILIVMGVSGSGKTTVGRKLAASLGWPYFEADDFHSQANIEKMSHGIPLNDEDRRPWLEAMHAKIAECAREKRSAVFSCSALKKSYRATLTQDVPAARFVYLKVSEAEVFERVKHRRGHYMKANMVHSQFETLEPPRNAITVDATQPPEEVLREIRAKAVGSCKR